MTGPIQNRYDFVILFDVQNGNPNGDPDAGNMPRIDPESGCGLVTDVCLKRKIRNYVETVMEDAPGYRIYIKEQVPLNRSDAEALDKLGVTGDLKAARKGDPDLDCKIRDYMCREFFDIRSFGAVMTTFVKGNLNCGQVRGPVQLGFAQSVEPITPQEVTITRVAITTEADAEKRIPKWGINTSFLTASTAPKAMCRPIWRAKPPGSPKRIWPCSGGRFLICLKTTAAQPVVRWLCGS